MVGLVDVLAPPDHVLRAPIGLSNGEVYRGRGEGREMREGGREGGDEKGGWGGRAQKGGVHLREEKVPQLLSAFLAT